MDAEVVSIQQASYRLNVSQDVIRRLVREGELKGYRKPGPDGRSPWVVELPADVEMVMPGDNVTMSVNLIAPIAMDEGLRFAMSTRRSRRRTVRSTVRS